jgi:transcription-repair coupling factor (superfamily II helicase)
LLIIDEEHRFGVKHKEKLKRILKAVDVLSLTATPIPRTLYMSLSGLRQLSIIDTPPRNRHPVKTEVLSFDEEVIERAVAEEVSRNGQVFFVHNRVQSIYSMQAFLERLLPGVRFCVAHGQMPEQNLEKAVLAFMEREYDVLISTMIIESGLDFPNVNTMIINRADRFGLAQLYQLRGRVGRREQQAYAYFLIPRQLSLTEGAGKRLQAMEEFEELGSGYRLAMRDLEIRGAGNVLGVEQHGHVAAIGFDLYCKMLKEAVDGMLGKEKTEVPECRVESPYRCYIPEEYVEDADERMFLYKRLAKMTTREEYEELESEMADRFGEPPVPARNLLDLAAVKVQAALLGIALVRFRPDRSRPGRRQDSAALQKALSRVDRIGRAVNGGPIRDESGFPSGGPRGAGEGGDSWRVEFEFAPGKALIPEQCARLVETFAARLLFKSGKTFGITLEAGASGRLLVDARNLLQVAYFSSRINACSAGD